MQQPARGQLQLQCKVLFVIGKNPDLNINIQATLPPQTDRFRKEPLRRERNRVCALTYKVVGVSKPSRFGIKRGIQPCRAEMTVGLMRVSIYQIDDTAAANGKNYASNMNRWMTTSATPPHLCALGELFLAKGKMYMTKGILYLTKWRGLAL